jgi:predicted PurR-regulated permease PerM
VALAGYIAQIFIVPLVWAGIIAIATWPIYKKLETWWRGRQTLVATVLTLLFSVIVVIPLLMFMTIIVHEARVFIRYLIEVNSTGVPIPVWLKNLPMMGDSMNEFWQDKLAKPQGLSEFLSSSHSSLLTMSGILKSIGLQIAHRAITFGFAVICLFFFYRDGEKLAAQIDSLGHHCLHHRWSLYAHKLPKAITATVVGVVLVGIAVGVIMGISYAIAGVQFSALLGGLTALLAMIPFAAPVIFGMVSLILLMQGSVVAAITILTLGAIVMFVADHFVRPILIGNATRLHFLAVFFGILGGVETLGLIGLFIGPVIMVLFSTLWSEPETTTPTQMSMLNNAK